MINRFNYKLRHCLLLLLLFMTGFVSAQTVVYVSPNGNDKNRGAIKSPFKTLERAKQASVNQNGDITIYLREGTHYLDTTLIWNVEDKIDDSKIIIKSYPGEQVRISGAKPLQLKWTPYKNGIMQANVKNAPVTFDQLVVNGKLMRMARYPNYDADEVRFGGVATDAISPERVNTWSNPEGRSEERRVGKECVSKCRTVGGAYD